MTDLLFYDRAAGLGTMFTYPYGPGDLFREYGNWRTTWDVIVPGNFAGSDSRSNKISDLLFYDRAAGHGVFYGSDGAGGIYPLSHTHAWRSTWDMIIPGKFSDSGYTDLLFYDRAAGHGAFYGSDGAGGIYPLSHTQNWRHTWDAIIPCGSYITGSGFEDLVFYDRGADRAVLYRSDGQGGLRTVDGTSNVGNPMTNGVAGRFAGRSDGGWIYFNNASRETVDEYHRMFNRASPEGALYDAFDTLFPTSNSNSPRWWIVTGLEESRILFYGGVSGASDGETAVYEITYAGDVGPVGNINTDAVLVDHRQGWRRSWTQIVPGHFRVTPDPQPEEPAFASFAYRIEALGPSGNPPSSPVRFTGHLVTAGSASIPPGANSFDQTATGTWALTIDQDRYYYTTSTTIGNLHLGTWSVQAESPPGVLRATCTPTLDTHGANLEVNFAENFAGCDRGFNFPGE